ncbi:hypothetical protein HanIR_Chr14g0678041 [Helianthus annuus]|nr:hypothetical protein HanIR_Chr14g0678041 [Helianthus annuus]
MLGYLFIQCSSKLLSRIYLLSVGFSENFGRVSSVNRGVHALIAYHFLLYKTNSSFSITKPTYRQTKRCILHFSFITRNRTVFEDFYKIVNPF